MFSFDWTLAQQRGNYNNRKIQAWGLFTQQSHAISEKAWDLSLTTQFDVASGGGINEGRILNGFNHLHSSSNYLGQGEFISLSNLLFISLGISISPVTNSKFSVEYGFARRLEENDAAYDGGMRVYQGIKNVMGHEVGNLLRLKGSWLTKYNTTVFAGYELFLPGEVLRLADLKSTERLIYFGAAFRF